MKHAGLTTTDEEEERDVNERCGQRKDRDEGQACANTVAKYGRFSTQALQRSTYLVSKPVLTEKII